MIPELSSISEYVVALDKAMIQKNSEILHRLQVECALNELKYSALVEMTVAKSVINKLETRIAECESRRIAAEEVATIEAALCRKAEEQRDEAISMLFSSRSTP